ncbi:phage tail assembly protein, partial [Aquabacterium sp.]|uniref:phage tail assembly protein n=1 Tax=Aquabacterium sp. TaxID=1872578 RepID=UPI00345C155A
MSEFVQLDANGDAIVTLAKPLTIAGVSVSALKMREPTVKDQLVMDATAGTDAQ